MSDEAIKTVICDLRLFAIGDQWGAVAELEDGREVPVWAVNGNEGIPPWEGDEKAYEDWYNRALEEAHRQGLYLEGELSEKSEDDILFKEFSHKGVTITRYDFESMPCPMFAKELGDDVMQKIAKEAYEYLIGIGWEDSQVTKYLGARKQKVSEFDATETIEMDSIEADFWRFIEKAAIENGMRYYEDMN